MKLILVFIVAFLFVLTGCKEPRPHHRHTPRTVIVNRPAPAPVHHVIKKAPPPKVVKRVPPKKVIKKAPSKPTKVPPKKVIKKAPSKPTKVPPPKKVPPRK